MTDLAALLGLTPEEVSETLDRMTPEQAVRALDLARIVDDDDAQKLLDHVFPEETHEWRGAPYYARDLYPKHMSFFAAQRRYREVCAMAANRIGKSFGMGGYSMAVYLTGLYPKWWPGRRFPGPIRAWACGKTNETARDIVQAILLGEVTGGGATKGVSGRGLIPGRLLGKPTWRSGVADLVDTIRVRHVSGRFSMLGLKSYAQGRGAFEGTAQHAIWLDEEPPADIYGECLIRTATTGGLILSTFTPLEGLSDVALMFMPGAQQDGS